MPSRATVIAIKTPSANYGVTIAPGILPALFGRLQKLAGTRTPRFFIVTSPNIWAMWSKPFLASFPPDAKPPFLFLPAGERHKRLATLESLASQLATAGADRDTILLAFGGGVVGDITGFLAAVYMRGIRYVQIPTTLLAQVDSSVGGKTGVNLAAGKNLVGAFHHPLAVLSDIDLLRTLPPAELRSGLQESIKAAIIRDPALFRFLETHRDLILAADPTPESTAALTRVVAASVRVKAQVVNADERESGLRMILNFGHTLGHAIEAATGYKTLLHGEAIAWGSIAAARVSLNRRLIDQPTFDRITALIRSYGPLPPFRASAEKLVALTHGDKKNRSGRRAFVLTTGIGSTQIASDVTDAELLSAARTTLQSIADIQTLSRRPLPPRRVEQTGTR